MELTDYRNSFRRLPVPISFFDTTGIERNVILDVKYRPVTQDWLDRNTEILKQIEERKRQAFDLSQVAIKAAEAANVAQELAEVSPDDDSLKATAAELKAQAEQRLQEFEDFRAKANKIAKRTLAEHLASLPLLDVDITDNGAKVEPTTDFLVTCDLEFLQDISEGVRKKTFRQPTSG